MAKKHIHKYHKVDLQFQTVWSCGYPDCQHYMPNHLIKLMIGRGSMCWNCGEALILDASKMSRNQPICDVCESSEQVNVDELIAAIGAKSND